MDKKLQEHLEQIKHDIETLAVEDMTDYFQDVLDIHYVVDSNKEYAGVILTLTCGGPNIYLDTYYGIIEGYWWTDTASVKLSKDTVEKINQFWQDIYDC